MMSGADPNVRSSYGTVALLDAVTAQHEDVVDLLLRHGADPHIADNNGTTPYRHAHLFRRYVTIEWGGMRIRQRLSYPVSFLSRYLERLVRSLVYLFIYLPSLPRIREPR